MKKLLLTLTTLTLAFTSIYAGTGTAANSTPASPRAGKEWLFKPLAAKDVSLELERIGPQVMLYLYSQNLKSVDMIYVEKSKDPTNNFTRCKTVKVSDHLIKSKNYIEAIDDNPYAWSDECYYRIRTVTASGDTKIYPAVNLSPLVAIEPIETVDNK
jgi:hypothetical protein